MLLSQNLKISILKCNNCECEQLSHVSPFCECLSPHTVVSVHLILLLSMAHSVVIPIWFIITSGLPVNPHQSVIAMVTSTYYHYQISMATVPQLDHTWLICRSTSNCGCHGYIMLLLPWLHQTVVAMVTPYCCCHGYSKLLLPWLHQIYL